MTAEDDPWTHLRSFTDARIALGRSGSSIPTREWLRFRRDHALARDAVWADLNVFDLENHLETLHLKHLKLGSRAESRAVYIQRPDLGRQLNEFSVNQLLKVPKVSYDLSITITEGLSALAIQEHAIPLLQAFLPLVTQYTLAPVCVVRQGRVAISDEVGELLNAQLSIILIGERPGLSSPDSMGIYLTYAPRSGNTDEKRNCISNIRREGLSYGFAAQKLAFLANEALTRKISGVGLKDTFEPKLTDGK